MNKESLIQSLKFILNKGFCQATVHRAIKEFNIIKPYLQESDSKKLGYYMMYLDPTYPDYIDADHRHTCEMFADCVMAIIKSIYNTK